MANLVIDIGSTALKAAWTEDVTIGRTFRYQGERIMNFILSITSQQRPEVMVVSTTRELTSRNKRILEGICDRLIIVDAKILSDNNIPSYITPDRAASIIAAKYIFKGHSLSIFDFGTTISLDRISCEGTYVSGAISPGCIARFRAIHRYSRHALPKLMELPEETSFDGLSLEGSIRKGVVEGICYEIEARIAENKDDICVFTGGDAIYFAKRLKNSIFAVCNLPLMGLALLSRGDDGN